jgi:hypothetical protein
MRKHLLSLLVSCLFVGPAFAQAPPTPAADDYNSIFKTLK